MTNERLTTPAAVGVQVAHVGPDKAASKKTTGQKKDAAQAHKVAKKTGPKTQQKGKGATSNSAAPKERGSSKKDVVLNLIGTSKGASIAEIANATGWQNHSVRGFISGTLVKKMGLSVVSSKNEAGERTYSIAK